MARGPDAVPVEGGGVVNQHVVHVFSVLHVTQIVEDTESVGHTHVGGCTWRKGKEAVNRSRVL